MPPLQRLDAQSPLTEHAAQLYCAHLPLAQSMS